MDKDQKQLINLIEKCIEKFASDPKYKNDARFYAIFYKYTQITSDPDDVYDSIYSLSLFDKLAKFYISWSWVLVNLCKEEKALSILNLGLEKKAEPINLLIQAKEELETSIGEKRTMHTSEPSNEPLSSSQHQVVVLRERKSRLSVEPISATVASLATRLSLSSKSLKANTPKENLLLKSTASRQGFEILEEDSDENRPDSSSEQTNRPSSAVAGHQEQTDREPSRQEQSHQTQPDQTNRPNDVSKPKVKQNLMQRMKPLDDYKEPKLVIFESLKPNQKFYADLKRMYADNTEYSFEEIRMRKMKKLARKHKESQPHCELVKEIEMLKSKIKENEQRDREKESLQNQVDMLKKQIEMIIQASSLATTTTQHSKRCLDEVDGPLADVDRTKKLKLSENKQLTGKVNKLRELPLKKDAEKELTIVRDMWNGTFASQYNTSQYSPASNQNEQRNKALEEKHVAGQRKEFSIFKDPTQSNLTKTNDFSYYPQMLSTTATQDCFTIALPRDPSEFNAKMASTPAMSRQRRF